MVNHDLARLTMIMARVPWLRTLGSAFLSIGDIRRKQELRHDKNTANYNIVGILQQQERGHMHCMQNHTLE